VFLERRNLLVGVTFLALNRKTWYELKNKLALNELGGGKELKADEKRGRLFPYTVGHHRDHLGDHR
jgi:hypothetical protein